jgi:hypothetical protein
MVTTLRSEYIGFTVNDTSRVYTMRARKPNGEFHDFQIAIGNQSFLSKRVRYQDAPEICFLRLKHELSLCDEDSTPTSQIQISDAELDAYREAHTKNAPPRVRTSF